MCVCVCVWGGWSRAKNLNFSYCDICYSIIFSFQNLVLLYSSIITFDFMTIHVKEVLWNIGKNAFYRKNCQFWHRIELFWESKSPILLKFGLQIDLRGDTKKWRGDFWNFDFKWFFRGLKFKIWSKSTIFGLWLPEKLRKIKISKIAASLFCITPKSISIPNMIIIGTVDSGKNSILCQN